MKIYFLYGRLKSFLKNNLTYRFGLIFIGISTTIWFLIRVIPKPQRAAYPCMQAAAPFMSGLVLYLSGLLGSSAAYRLAKKNFRRSRYLLAATFLIIALFFTFLFISQENFPAFAIENTTVSNDPTGIGRGIFPGRVVWVFDPAVAKYDGKTGYWWDETNTPQTESDKMLTNALIHLSGKKTESQAWDTLFRHFNLTKRNAIAGYSIHQKIAVKINQNNTSSQTNSANINATPQLVLSLLRSLVKEAGVPQNKITVFDASRFITNNLYTKCHSEFPDVIFVDNIGGNGRTKATYSDNAIPFSVDNGALAKGIATCAVEADYLINMALLKGHSGQGVTLCGKNFYGATSIYSSPSKNAHNNFNPDATGKDRYMTFTDYLGHKDLGEKTMLFMIDGFYGSRTVSGVPNLRWKMPPFNNSWPASLYISQDAVAVDAVGLDFLRNEWPDMADIRYAEKYLIESSKADNPPSQTFYDPERDHIRCKSLGVMESWNNSSDKQYSRNLGKDYGIELHFVDLRINTGVEIKPVGSEGFISCTVYPNPFRETTNLHFKIGKNSPLTLSVFDHQGRRLVSENLGFFVPGEHQYVFKRGNLSPGIYLYKIETSGSDCMTGRFTIGD